MAFSDEEMRRRLPRRTLVLAIVSALSTVSIILSLPGFPALILAGLAVFMWRRGSFERARRLTTIGWGVFIGVILLQIVATVFDLGTR
jgi:hypothetical protein